MAWIKLLSTFLKAPALIRMRRHLGISKEKTAYLAISWLLYLDENTTDGATRMLPEEIDELFAQRNFSAALISATWAKLEPDGTLSAQDYDLHNGDNTKKRLQQSIYDSRRKSGNSKKKSGADATSAPERNLENPRTQSGKSQTGIWTREEKRREDNIQPSTLAQRSIAPPPRTTNHHRQNDCNANRRYDL